MKPKMTCLNKLTVLIFYHFSLVSVIQTHINNLFLFKYSFSGSWIFETLSQDTHFT